MLSLKLEIMIIAILTAISCVLPGVFLVLRGVAMMSDAISHAILLGIVTMFLWVKRLESPLLLVGAAAAGVFTVLCTEMIIKSNRLKSDAAIGLIFPLYFSVGVILISQYARNVHIDTDMVLLGEIAFTPFNRLCIHGIDCGPYALWIIGFSLLCNALFVACFFKELLITTFDAPLSVMLGFSPLVVHYSLMIITSMTTVAAFDVVGSIMVVALMITPPATAYLVTHNVKKMLILSVLIAIISAVSGCLFASYDDVSIAGSISTMTGLFFIGFLLFKKNLGYKY